MTATLAPVEPPRRPRAGPVRRIVLGLGLVMILTGLGFLGYCGWQYYGTNVVSKQKHAEIKQSIAGSWDEGVDGKGVGLLRVERFGRDYEVPIVKGFSDKALAEGIGWDTKSARPGEIGNFAIAAHRVTHGEPFAKFPDLRKGDEVVVETRTKVFTYRLRQGGTDITVDFSVGWPLQRVPAPDAAGERPTKAVITLLTCSELFHTRNRSVVIGDLVSQEDKRTGKVTKVR
ncbi:sortase domain-containing protein [Aeromicrobium wangtongii]|uniref:Sortase n=1 Tax=Aeromicrobium wangtongii TaxID=2969247 RepID=A0ABY5MDW8_9ACTN|nr:sortase [Aeromicrobium wangtongii]MCD9199670.1 sortase [Aeromicrobium wangtongii]UUP14021.1 sortase [Aeromicrobium wangtongii]